MDREVFWTVIAGRRSPVDLACGETQAEHLWNLILRRRDDDCDGADGDSAAAGVVHSQSSSCCTSLQVIHNLTTAEARKDAPSLINTHETGRRKEFSGKEEDFQQWSKETWHSSLE